MKTFRKDELDDEPIARNNHANTFDQIADAIGYTKQTAIRDHKKALAKARRILKSKGFNADYFFKD